MTTLGKRLIASPVSSSSSDDGQKFLRSLLRSENGGAILFANIDMNGPPDPVTIPAGLAAIEGEKWLFSHWIRSGPLPP